MTEEQTLIKERAVEIIRKHKEHREYILACKAAQICDVCGSSMRDVTSLFTRIVGLGWFQTWRCVSCGHEYDY